MTNCKIKKICDDAGVRFDGLQEGKNGQLIIFTDLLTGSTLAIEKEKFSNPAVQARVTRSRRDYPEEIQMQSDFMDAIRFITRKKTLPANVIMNAAIAATVVVSNYLKEEKEKANIELTESLKKELAKIILPSVQ